MGDDELLEKQTKSWRKSSGPKAVLIGNGKYNDTVCDRIARAVASGDGSIHGKFFNFKIFQSKYKVQRGLPHAGNNERVNEKSISVEAYRE